MRDSLHLFAQRKKEVGIEPERVSHVWKDVIGYADINARARIILFRVDERELKDVADFRLGIVGKRKGELSVKTID